MPLSLKQRHRLLTADRTHDAGWIAAVVENLLAVDPTVTLAEVEDAFRDGFAQSYLIAGPGKTFQVITGGFPSWRNALNSAGVTAEENRAALAGG
jgi:hypothetical protein